jgi:hypothetical protein
VSGIEYRRIDPGFRSMGSYFFNNDIEHITFNQSLGLMKNKMNLRGSLGLQRDNLNSQKKNTAKRLIGALSGSYNINQSWGIDASFNNFSTNQRAFQKSEIDTLFIFQVNRTINLLPRYVKATEKTSHMVMLNLNYTTLEDKNKRTADMTNTDTYMAMLMYNLGLLPIQANLSASVNYIEMKNKNFQMEMIGGNVNLSKPFFENKLSLNWGNNLMFNNMGENSSIIYNTMLSASYRFHPKHNVSFNFNAISNRFKSPINPSYGEIRGDISYVFTF